MMIEVLVAAIFGALYLREPITLRLLLGSGLILGCGFALMVKSANTPRQQAPNLSSQRL